MATLNNKIDFALVFTVRNANPNGDPLGGNRPRTTSDGHGEVSDVCLKRKIRNRWMDEGYPVFVQSDDRRVDAFRSLRDRADGCPALKACLDAMGEQKKAKGKKNGEALLSKDDYARIACEQWLDVRAFGQVFAFKADKKSDKKADTDDAASVSDNVSESDAVSVGIRGPVSIQSAFSLDIVPITNLQITKSVNLKTDSVDPDKRGSDTIGSKYRVDFGVYVTYGSINVQAAQKTGFSDDDALALKEALRTLFRNDATAARPDGSMEVVKLIWWEHNCACGQYSAAKVHRSLDVSTTPEISVSVDKSTIPGLKYSIIDGE